MEDNYEDYCGNDYNDYLDRCVDEDYYEEEHYETFSGSYAQEYEGLSDEYIWDAFGVDPDAYWNID